MITLTDRANRKIQQVILKRGRGAGIRLGVKTTGCSGLAYVLEYVDEANEDDKCIDCNNCKIFVDAKSCPYLEGMEIDYMREGLNEGFKFNNPNERDKCGCGESFRV
jgi:iron-sulfur cluster assembly protein